MKRLIPLALSVMMAVSATAPGAFAATKVAPVKAPAHKEQVKPNKASSTLAGPVSKEEKKPTAAEIDASIASAASVDSLTLMKSPDSYLNKKVTFAATFNRFADTGLDYKKAFRDSRDFVSFYVLRPDVGDRTIPLSEMKLFFPRKKSSEVMELEAGDKVQIVGTEFSTALGEPWVDVEHIKILQKTPRPERKHNTPEF